MRGIRIFIAFVLAGALARAETIRDAAMAGDLATVRAKLDAGTPVDEENGYRLTALYYAVTRNKPEVARLLLERGADANHSTDAIDFQGTILAFAVQHGDEAMTVLLLEHGGDPNKSPRGAYSPIQSAVDLQIAKLLLDHGGNPNAGGRNASTALSLAAARGDMAAVRFWLDHGADINAGANDYQLENRFDLDLESDRHAAYSGTALMAAAARNDRPMLDFLLARRAKLTVRNRLDQVICPALYVAIHDGRLDLVHYLLDKGASANDATSMPPLSRAALTGRADVVRLLLDRGASVAIGPNGSSPLESAVLSGNVAIVGMLLDAGAEWSGVRFDGPIPSPLHLALAPLGGAHGWPGKEPPPPTWERINHSPLLDAPDDDCVEMLEYLMNHGVDAATALTTTPAVLPMAAGRPKIMAYLLDRGAPIDGGDASKWTALHYAALLRDTSPTLSLEFLLARGAAVDARDDTGRTPLMYAASTHNAAACIRLLQAGAEINASGRMGETALLLAIPSHFAAGSRESDDVQNLAVIRLLLARGADANMPTTYGLTVLHCAAESGSTTTLQMLLDHKAKVEAVDRLSGTTPLHKAATPEIARMLLKAGANIRARDRHDRTPLHLWLRKSTYLSSARIVEFVRLAAEYGADLSAQDGLDGETPLDAALSEQNQAAAELIVRLGGKKRMDIRL